MAVTGTSRLAKPSSAETFASSSGVAWLLVAGCPILFALATWPVPGFTQQDSIRHFSMPVLATELAIIVIAMRDGFQPRAALAKAPKWIGMALTTLTIVAIGTALFVAPDRPGAVLRTSGSVIHALFALSIGHFFVGSWRTLAPLLWPSIAMGTLGYGLVLTAYVATIVEPKTYDWVFFQLAVTHVRQLGFYSVVGAGAALGLAITAADKRAYWTWLGVASAMIAISFWSGTRSSLIALAAAYVVSLRLFPMLRRTTAWAGLLVSMLAGFTIALLHRVPNPAFGPFRLWAASSGEDPGSGRLDVWWGTVRVYLERPLFGYGESQFKILVPEAAGAYNHPHNIFLQILFQWGLVGAICYFALGAFAWLRFEKAAQQIGPQAIPAYLVALSIVIYSLYEGTLYHPYPIAMLAVAIASVIAIARPPIKAIPTNRSKAPASSPNTTVP